MFGFGAFDTLLLLIACGLPVAIVAAVAVVLLTWRRRRE